MTFNENCFKKFLLLIFSILFSTTLSAFTFPSNCIKIHSHQETNFILHRTPHTQNASLFFIYNNSKTDRITLLREQKSQGAQAGWSSTLDANHWSALVVDVNDFKLTCASNIAQNKTCIKKMIVCKPAQQTQHLSGNYWFVENQPWKKFISQVNARLKK